MNNLYYMGLYNGNDYWRSNYNPEYTIERKDGIFYNENEGFVKGNIQKNIYQSYKGYNPSMPNVGNDKDRLLLEIQKYGFNLIDLGLYLDLHPNDKAALADFNDNRVKYFRLVSEFNKNFYPLMFMDSSSNETYRWLDGKFPISGGN